MRQDNTQIQPNLEQLIRSMFGFLSRPKRFLFSLLFLLFVIGIFGSFYTVDTESEGVILRFGKYTRTEKPGLHMKIPFGIEKCLSVPVLRQLKLEFGFNAENIVQVTNPWQYKKETEQKKEKLMITGDKNAATVEWVVHYHIANPQDYLFNVISPEETLRDASESVMRAVVGDRTVDEVLTIGRQDIENESLIKLQKLVNDYLIGFNINQVQLINVKPPPAVEPSFNLVNSSQQMREEMINDARGAYNKRVPRTRGEADQKIASAQGSAIKRINEAEGDANRFMALLAEYTKAPAVTRKRLYLETMADVLPKLKNKIILDQDAKGLLPLLHLNDGTARQLEP